MKKAKIYAATFLICLLSIGIASATTTGDPWLDQVVSFVQPLGSSDAGGLPVYALGSADDGLYVSIDIPEILTLAFTDNTAFNGVGDDLRIYEKFNSETIGVYVSADNRSYTYLGVAGPSQFSFDLESLSYINYVKFVGLDDGGGNAGFDLMAVEALHSGPHVPIPGSVLLFCSGLLGLIGLQRKRRN